MSSNDPGIICFQHCSSKAIFCKEVPQICPICEETISEYILQPFRLPYPFSNAAERPVTIVVRPSNGDFLNHYAVSDDLHIGIVNSEGQVVEFDKYGIIFEDTFKWKDCLAIKIVPESWDDHWDWTLEILCADEKWNSSNYKEDTLNCFNFVIEFLMNLRYKYLEHTNKVDFCEKFLMPQIQDTLKYISFYRKLKDTDYFVPN